MKRSLIRSLVACSLASSGCAVVDQFGNRAVDYNIEGERARNQFLLLNIIRSAYHKPMQFSVLTTVTGTATVSGGLSSVLPLGGPASGYQINPSNLLSGGPTFTVANQVDKEFYQGILTPVAKQTVDWLFQAGYPKQLVLTLLVSKISFQRADEKKVAQSEFLNHPFGYFQDFQEVIDELVNEGITTKRSDSTDEIGPPLTSAQAAQMDGISKLKAQGLDLDKTKKSGRSTTTSTYQISKSETDYRFCFDTMRSAVSNYKPALHARLLDRIGQSAIDALACNKEQDNAETPPCDNSTNFVQRGSCTKAGNTTHADALEFTFRSTLGVIYYLGEISRGELKLVDDESFVAPTLLFHKKNFPDEVDSLFNLRRATGDPALTVGYQGTDYSVVADPGHGDHSSQVLDLVEQLTALNSSNKNLPSSSVVNLIGH
jgi:hypothetical protein